MDWEIKNCKIHGPTVDFLPMVLNRYVCGTARHISNSSLHECVIYAHHGTCNHSAIWYSGWVF